MRRVMERDTPHLPLLTAWLTFVSVGVTSLRAFPSANWLEGLAAAAEELCAREVDRFAARLEREVSRVLRSRLSAVIMKS